MSLEKFTSGKPSRCIPGEGCHAASSNRQVGAVDSGGVCEGDTTGRETKISQEISGRVAVQPQPLMQGGEPSQVGWADGEVGVLRSSQETVETQTTEERREGTWVNANANSEGSGDGWLEAARLFDQITTPPKIQQLQRTLDRKAKAESKDRFYSLSGELLRKDMLETAMSSVAHNHGAGGVDGQTCEVYLKSDEAWDPWREGWLLPILEADSHPNSYAYRPKRGAHQAMGAIRKGMLQGRVEVLDADWSGYFDSRPQGKRLRIVARRTSWIGKGTNAANSSPGW